MAVPSAIASAEDIQGLVASISDVATHYKADPGPSGMETRLQLINMAKQLMFGLMEPGDAASYHLSNAMEVIAVRTLLDLKIFHSIPPQGSISLKDLAKKTNSEQSLIERLLRMVVCSGFVQQLENLEYAHTKFSLAYTAVPGPGMFFQLVYDESVLMIDNFHMYLREKGRKEPIDQKYSPYAWKSGQEGKDIWSIMAQTPERLHAFQAGLAFADASIPLVGYYDFGKLNTEGDRPILVDVGGGGGQAIVQIMNAHPELPAENFVLQDLKEPIELARAGSFLPKGVQTMEHDFWTPQPVKGAKCYLIRRILHDYGDPFCITILKHIKEVMAPDSVILIGDLLLSTRATPTDVVPAMYSTIIFNMAGKERTPEGFKYIVESAGLEFVKIWSQGAGSLIEAKLPA